MIKGSKLARYSIPSLGIYSQHAEERETVGPAQGGTDPPPARQPMDPGCSSINPASKTMQRVPHRRQRRRRRWEPFLVLLDAGRVINELTGFPPVGKYAGKSLQRIWISGREANDLLPLSLSLFLFLSAFSFVFRGSGGVRAPPGTITSVHESASNWLPGEGSLWKI